MSNTSKIVTTVVIIILIIVGIIWYMGKSSNSMANNTAPVSGN